MVYYSLFHLEYEFGEVYLGDPTFNRKWAFYQQRLILTVDMQSARQLKLTTTLIVAQQGRPSIYTDKHLFCPFCFLTKL